MYYGCAMSVQRRAMFPPQLGQPSRLPHLATSFPWPWAYIPSPALFPSSSLPLFIISALHYSLLYSLHTPVSQQSYHPHCLSTSIVTLYPFRCILHNDPLFILVSSLAATYGTVRPDCSCCRRQSQRSRFQVLLRERNSVLHER